MKQRLKRKQLSAVAGIFAVLALVAGIMALSAVLFVAAAALRTLGIDVSFMQYAQYVLLIIAGVFIVRRYMTEYEYAITDDELAVSRYIGERPRELLRIKIDNIVSINRRKPERLRPQRLTYKPRRSGVTYIIYTENGKSKCACLSPSAELLALLERRAAKRQAQ